MADTEKRWFEVTAAIEVSVEVLARDKDEAEKRFWQREEYIEDMLEWGLVQVTSVVECEPDGEGEEARDQ
jgi:hypothetical protein